MPSALGIAMTADLNSYTDDLHTAHWVNRSKFAVT